MEERTSKKKYHGYLVFPRHVLMIYYDLGDTLFGSYISLVLLARWHRKNPQMGCVIGTQEEIASFLHIKQPTLSRKLDKLQKKKYVIKHKRYVVLKYFPLFLSDVGTKISNRKYPSLHELYAHIHKINSEMQDKYDEMHDNRGQKDTQRLYSSSNDNLGFNLESNDISAINNILTEDEEIPF